MKLSGKIALVTGGSRGIGLATAKILSEQGAIVAITAKNTERLEKAVLEIPNAIGIAADIRKTNDVKNVVNKIIEKFGKLDILVNNAGIFPEIKKLHEIDEDKWNEVLDVNLTGQFRFTKEAIPHLLKTKGSLVAVSSVTGFKGLPGRSGYAASKLQLRHESAVRFCSLVAPRTRYSNH